jgi:cytochrome o ubiquinol oxidase subunit 1
VIGRSFSNDNGYYIPASTVQAIEERRSGAGEALELAEVD